MDWSKRKRKPIPQFRNAGRSKEFDPQEIAEQTPTEPYPNRNQNHEKDRRKEGNEGSQGNARDQGKEDGRKEVHVEDEQAHPQKEGLKSNRAGRHQPLPALSFAEATTHTANEQ